MVKARLVYCDRICRCQYSNVGNYRRIAPRHTIAIRSYVHEEIEVKGFSFLVFYGRICVFSHLFNEIPCLAAPLVELYSLHGTNSKAFPAAYAAAFVYQCLSVVHLYGSLRAYIRASFAAYAFVAIHLRACRMLVSFSYCRGASHCYVFYASSKSSHFMSFEMGYHYHGVSIYYI